MSVLKKVEAAKMIQQNRMKMGEQWNKLIKQNKKL
jgi:hypothetical protein